MESTEYICKNCGNQFQGLYCNACGQKVIRKRYTLKHLLELVLESFNVERGLFYTVKLLFTDPGKLINNYLDGRTKDFYNPLKYLILIASLNAILMLWLDIFDTNVASTNELIGSDPEGNKLQKIILGYFRTYLNVFSLIVLPFYSLASKWVFKKHKLYYAEHLVIHGYLFAQYTLLQMITYLLFYAIPGLLKFSMPVAFVVFVSYYTYALKGVFNIRFFRSLLGAMIIFILGFVLFMLFFLLIMIIVIVVLRLTGYDLKELTQV